MEESLNWELHSLNIMFDVADETQVISHLSKYLGNSKQFLKDYEYFMNLVCIKNKIQLFNFLVSLNQNLHYKEEMPLRFAIKNESYDIAKVLIEKHNADYHAQNEYCIRYCVTNNNFSMVLYFLEKGVNLTICDHVLVKTCVSLGNLPILKLLHQKGADLFSNKEMLFFSAIKSNNKELIKYLLENGFSFTSYENDSYENDICGICLIIEEKELFEYLVSLGLNRNKIDSNLLMQIDNLEKREDNVLI